MTLHYTSGGSGSAISAAGFNLADVSSVSELNALPAGMKGLVWLGLNGGASAAFIAAIKPFIGNPKLFGFYLWDEPDPTGKWGELVKPANLKAQSDWVHANVPGAKTFIVLMDLGSSANPTYAGSYNPANTGIDLYGLDPYPVRTNSLDYNQIERTVAAAVAFGIPVAKIVPVYQTFGGGNYNTDTGDKYVIPTPAQMQIMLDRWVKLCPNPVFDYAYAWGEQEGDAALGSSGQSALRALFLKFNAGTAPAPPPEPVNLLAVRLRKYAEQLESGVITSKQATIISPSDGTVIILP